MIDPFSTNLAYPVNYLKSRKMKTRMSHFKEALAELNTLTEKIFTTFLKHGYAKKNKKYNNKK